MDVFGELLLLLIGVKLLLLFIMLGPPALPICGCGCGDCCEGFMGPPFIRLPGGIFPDGPLGSGLCMGGPIGGPLFILGPEFRGELIELPMGEPIGIGEFDMGRPGPGPIWFIPWLESPCCKPIGERFGFMFPIGESPPI